MAELFEVALFGRTTEEFLKTGLGRYLVRQAEAKVEAALDQLKKVLPWRRRRIQQLQNEIAVWEGFQQSLAEVIMNGEHALNLLEE